MPYILDRRRFNDINNTLELTHISNCGELNYVLSRVVDTYLLTCSNLDRSLKYSRINDAIGALECAKLELYRRIAAPLEDKKLIDNGEVYDVQNHGE